jgi:hypothetical protein
VTVGRSGGSVKKGRVAVAEEKTAALIARAQGFGLRLEYRSGFLIITRPTSTDRRRDELIEMEHVVIEQLGKRLAEVRARVIAAARAARGREFIGERVFIPLVGIGERGRGDREGRVTTSQITGKLVAWSDEGTLTVSHVEVRDGERLERMATCGFDETYIVVDGGDQANRTAAFASIGDERIRRGLERGQSIGLAIELDGGFTVAKWNVAPEDQDAGEEILRELGRPRKLLRILEGIARGATGSEFVGRRAFVSPVDAVGVIRSCAFDGRVDVEYSDKNLGSRATCQFVGDDLLIVLDAETGGRATVPEASPAPKSWLRRAFGD